MHVPRALGKFKVTLPVEILFLLVLMTIKQLHFVLMMMIEETNTDKISTLVNEICSCDKDRSTPYKFFDISSSKRKKHRVFQKKWFSDFKWLSYCLTRNAILCCKVKGKKGLISSKRYDSTFLTKGFCNWREKFREHELSQTHKEAVFKYDRPSVVLLANSALKKDQQVRRNMLMMQLHSLRFLMRQRLPVRGHSGEGNLHQLMKLQAHDSPQLYIWLKDQKYQSPEIVNEQMSKQLLRSLLAEIKSEENYAIIADKTGDISGKEQLAISLRWVNSSYEVHEDLIALINVEATDASFLKTVIQDCFTRCDLSLSNCCG